MTPPKYKQENIFRETLKYLGPVLPPLGIAWLASILQKEGHEVKVIDGSCGSMVFNYGFDDLSRDIIDFKPDVVGIGTAMALIELTNKTLELIKEINPNIITIVGGPIVSSDPEFVLKISNTDYYITGEADKTLPDVIRKIRDKKEVNGSEGTIWVEGKVVKSIRPKQIADVNKLPFPARHLLNMRIYRPSPANYRRLPATGMITSRGCPFNCIYCSKPVHGRSFRPHSAGQVVAEMEQLVCKYNIKDFQIFDDTFTADPKRIEKVCQSIIKKKLDIGWTCMTRIDRISVDLLKLMKKAGCFEIGIGIESGSDRILKLIRKKTTTQMVRNAIEIAKKAKMDVRGFFQIGFPTETKEEIEQTIRFASELELDIAQIMIATPFPGTDMWIMAKKEGKINTEDWSTFTKYAPKGMPFSSKLMSDEELANYYKKAYKSFYLRPAFVIRHISKIRSITDLHRYWLAARGILGF